MVRRAIAAPRIHVKRPGKPGLFLSIATVLYAAALASLVFFDLPVAVGAGVSFPAFAALPDLTGLVSSLASAAGSGRSISSTNAIGALSPTRNPNLRMRR